MMSQGYYELLMHAIIVVSYLASIVCEARGDALIDIDWKRRYKLKEVKILGLFIIPFFAYEIFYTTRFDMIISLVATYIFLRIGVFNPVYSLTRGFGIYFVGTMNWYDRFLKKLLRIESRTDMPIIKGFPALTFWYITMLFLGLFIGFGI